MVKDKSDEGETYRSHICDRVCGVTGALDVSISTFEGEKSDFGQKSLCAPKVVCRSRRRHSRALSGGAKGESLDAVLGDHLIGSFDEGSAQVSVMIGRTFLRHFCSNVDSVQMCGYCLEKHNAAAFPHKLYAVQIRKASCIQEKWNEQ